MPVRKNTHVTAVLWWAMPESMSAMSAAAAAWPGIISCTARRSARAFCRSPDSLLVATRNTARR